MMERGFAGYFGDKPDVLIEFEKLCTVVYKRTHPLLLIPCEHDFLS
jgi:hypothetical protein